MNEKYLKLMSIAKQPLHKIVYPTFSCLLALVPIWSTRMLSILGKHLNLVIKHILAQSIAQFCDINKTWQLQKLEEKKKMFKHIFSCHEGVFQN